LINKLKGCFTVINMLRKAFSIKDLKNTFLNLTGLTNLLGFGIPTKPKKSYLRHSQFVKIAKTGEIARFINPYFR